MFVRTIRDFTSKGVHYFHIIIPWTVCAKLLKLYYIEKGNVRKGLNKKTSKLRINFDPKSIVNTHKIPSTYKLSTGLFSTKLVRSESELRNFLVFINRNMIRYTLLSPAKPSRLCMKAKNPQKQTPTIKNAKCHDSNMKIGI